MRLNFFDAQLKLAPEYFISSVGLRVKFLELEYYLPGIINYDELEVQFQQTLSIPNTFFESKEIVVHVELLAAIDDARSRTRRIGLGSLTINDGRNDSNLMDVPLCSKNLDIVMAQLKVSITTDQTATADCNESDWDKDLSLSPSTSASVTGSNRTATHVDRENHFSSSFSRVSCLTYGSTLNQSSAIQPTSSYAALSEKIHGQLSAIRKECFIENFDNSVPEISTTGRYENPDPDNFDTLRKFQLENNLDRNMMAGFSRPLRSEEHKGEDRMHDGEYTTALINDDERNKVVLLSNTRREEVQQNDDQQKFKERAEHFGSHVPRLEKKLQKGKGSQGKEEEGNEIDVKESHGRRYFSLSATKKHISCYEDLSRDSDLEKSCRDNFRIVIPETSFAKKPDNIRADESNSSSGNGKTHPSRETSVSTASHVRKLVTAVASESIPSTRIAKRERRRIVQERASDRFQIFGALSSGRQETKSAGRSKNNMAVSNTPIYEIIDDLGLQLRPSYKNSRVVNKNKSHIDNCTEMRGMKYFENLEPVTVRTLTKPPFCHSIDGNNTDINNVKNINQAIKRILEGKDFDSISAQQIRLDSAEKRRCEVLQATKARAQNMASKSTLKAKAIKEAVQLSCAAFDKLRNDFDKKNAIRNKNEKSSEGRVSCSRSACFGSARARSEDRRSSINRLKGGLLDPAVDACRDRANLLDDMRLYRNTKRSTQSGEALLPYSDLRRRSRSTSNLLPQQESTICFSSSVAHDRGRKRTKDVTDPCGSALSVSSARVVGIEERGRRKHRERETISIGSERTQRTSLRARDLNDNQIKPVSTTVLPRQLIISNIQPNNGFSGSEQLIRRARSASQSDRVPNSQVRIDANTKYSDPHNTRRSRSTHSAFAATSLKNPYSTKSQILLVTLVLERIDAIKRNISAATAFEAKNMLGMIEKLLSLAMSLTSVDKKQDSVIVKCVLLDKKPTTDCASIPSNRTYISKQSEIEKEDLMSETTSLNTNCISNYMSNNPKSDKVEENHEKSSAIKLKILRASESRKLSAAAWDSDSDSDSDDLENIYAVRKNDSDSDSRDESQSESESQCFPSTCNSGSALEFRSDTFTHGSLEETSQGVLNSSGTSSSESSCSSSSKSSGTSSNKSSGSSSSKPSGTSSSKSSDTSSSKSSDTSNSKSSGTSSSKASGISSSKSSGTSSSKPSGTSSSKSSDTSSSKSSGTSSSKSSGTSRSNFNTEESSDTESERIFRIVQRMNTDNDNYSSENDDNNCESTNDNMDVLNIRNSKNDLIGKSKDKGDPSSNTDRNLVRIVPSIGVKNLLGNMKNRKKIEKIYDYDSLSANSSDDSDDVFDLQKAFAVDDITVSTQSTYDSNAIFFSPKLRRV